MISRSTARWGLPCCPGSRCVRAVVPTPVEPLGACRSLPQRCQLSLYKRQVSLHIALFGACSTFTRVTARTLAESLDDPFHRRLQPGRYLPDCSDCSRPKRPLPEGTCTLSRTVPFHGTRLCRALPGDEFVLPPSLANSRPLRARSGAKDLRQLDTSNGCQDHTLLPSASAPFVLRARSPLTSELALRYRRARRCRVHRIPPQRS